MMTDVSKNETVVKNRPFYQVLSDPIFHLVCQMKIGSFYSNVYKLGFLARLLLQAQVYFKVGSEG